MYIIYIDQTFDFRVAKAELYEKKKRKKKAPLFDSLDDPRLTLRQLLRAILSNVIFNESNVYLKNRSSDRTFDRSNHFRRWSWLRKETHWHKEYCGYAVSERRTISQRRELRDTLAEQLSRS